MDREEVDHYAILGLGCGSEIVNLSRCVSEQEISKAYRSMARQLHPDKRPDDGDAHANFLKLQTSYHLLKNPRSRKLFDDGLLRRIKLQQRNKNKKRKMMSDLEDSERANPLARARQQEEERISRQLKHEISRIIAMHHSTKNPPPPPPPPPPSKQDATPPSHQKAKIRYPHHFETSVLHKLIKASRDQGHLH